MRCGWKSGIGNPVYAGLRARQRLSFRSRNLARAPLPRTEGTRKAGHRPNRKDFDVAVDIRRDSPRFGQWVGLELDADHPRQLWIPPGFAHGFCVTSQRADFLYKCTEYYSPATEGAIRWNDPNLAIDWPVPNPVLSEKDAVAPLLSEAQTLPSMDDNA